MGVVLGRGRGVYLDVEVEWWFWGIIESAHCMLYRCRPGLQRPASLVWSCHEYIHEEHTV